MTRPRRPNTRPIPHGPSVLAAGLVLTLAACADGLPGAGDAIPGRHAEGATRIVLLGTSHFAGSLTDANTSEVGDVLSDRRQKELDELAERLADWGTDAFLLECTPDRQGRMDSLYAAYRAGDYDPTAAGDRNEIYQLGFRAAGRAGLERVRCVDAGGVWLGSRARQVAEEHNPDVLDDMNRLDEMRLDDGAFLADHTLREYLVAMNAQDALWANHKAYAYYFVRMGTFEGSGTKIRREGDLGGATFALGDDVPPSLRHRARRAVRRLDGEIVEAAGPGTDYVVLADREVAASEAGPSTGADTLSVRGMADLVQRHSETFVGFPDHHIGADLVGEWYKRNLRIYANIWRAVQEDDDRVVFLVGQGHVWSLRTFLRENPDFEVVPVDEVL